MDLREILAAEARAQGVPTDLALAVMQRESGGRPNAVSPKGAIGPMQLMPATARELGVDPADPVQNIRGGVRYLRQQLDAFGDPALALAAYNAGPGAARRAGGVPNYPETQAYVRGIMGTTQQRRDARDDSDIFADLPGSSPAPRSGARGKNAGSSPPRSDDSDIFADLPKGGGALLSSGGAAARPDKEMRAGSVGDLALGLARGGRDLLDGAAYLAERGVRSMAPGVARTIDRAGSTINSGLRSILPARTADRLMDTRSVSDVNKAAEREYQDATPGSVAAGVGRVGGNVATALVPGLGQVEGARKVANTWQAGNRLTALGQAGALGASQGAVYGTRTDDDSIGANAAGGALGGVVGQLAAAGIGAGVRSVRNAIAGDELRVGRILERSADDSISLRRSLERGVAGGELVPGSVPMTHQLADDAGVSQLFRTAKNAGARGIVDRETAQNAARVAALEGLAPGAGGRTSIEAAEAAGNAIKGETEPLRAALKDAIRYAYNVPELQGVYLTPPKAEVQGIAREMFPAGIRMPGQFADTVDALSKGIPIAFPELQALRSFASKQAVGLSLTDKTQAAAFAKVRDLIDALPDRAVATGALDQASSDAFKHAKTLRTKLGRDFETGAAKGVWERGADGLPKRQGAEVARGFYNSGASQAADIEQFKRMTQGLPAPREQLRDYAVSDLLEKASTQTGLSSAKFQAYARARSEALRGLLTDEERDTVNRVATDLWRAAQAESKGMAKGSPTVQNAMGGGMLESPGLRAGLRMLPIVNRVASPLLDMAASGARSKNAELVGRAMLEPEFALSGLLSAQASNPAWWNQRVAPGLLAGSAPLTQGLLSMQQ